MGVDIFVSEPNRNRGLPTTGTFTIDSTDWATQLRAQLHAEIGDPVERVLDIELSRRAEF